MRQTAFIGTFLLLLSVAANAADQQLLNMVMPDAKVVAGVNVLQAKASPFGNYVLLQMTANQTGMQGFVNATGFNPALDVTEILAATSGDKTTPAGILMARGTFDTASITAAILKDGKHQSTPYSGATLVTSSDPAQKEAVAFLNGTIAIAGDLVSVKAALDRKSSTSTISPDLAAQVAALSSTQDAWTISIASLASLFPAAPAATTSGGAASPGLKHGAGARSMAGMDQLAIFKNVQQSSGGVKFGSDVKVTAQAVTTDAKDATALGDVIRFVAQLVSMNASKDAQMAGAASLLQNLNVTTDGTAVNIAMSIPESSLEALLNSKHQPAISIR